MSELFPYWRFFAFPIGQVLVALLVGGYLLRRSKETRSYLQWSIGISVITAAVFAGLALGWLYVEVLNTYSFGALIVLIAPALPLAVIVLMSTLSFCACVLWGSRQDRFVTRLGFLTGPSKSLVRLSGGALAFAGTIGVYLLLPFIHLLPYSSLTSDNRSSQITLMGYRFSGQFEPVISLQTIQWPEYNPSFRLKLDWRGRAILDVWHKGTTTEPETTATYYLPFRESAYRLDNGILVAIEK